VKIYSVYFVSSGDFVHVFVQANNFHKKQEINKQTNNIIKIGRKMFTSAKYTQNPTLNRTKLKPRKTIPPKK
jgi:hypothetical protein